MSIRRDVSRLRHHIMISPGTPPYRQKTFTCHSCEQYRDVTVVDTSTVLMIPMVSVPCRSESPRTVVSILGAS